jgi:hypothetical protein
MPAPRQQQPERTRRVTVHRVFAERLAILAERNGTTVEAELERAVVEGLERDRYERMVAQQLYKLADRNGTTPGQETDRAVRELLEREGLLRPQRATIRKAR